MIIEDKRELDYIEFSRLDPGDVFVDGNGLFFMVLDYEYNETERNAVELDEGYLVRVQDDDKVLPVKAKLVIEALEEPPRPSRPRPIDPTCAVDPESGVVPRSAIETRPHNVTVCIDKERSE